MWGFRRPFCSVPHISIPLHLGVTANADFAISYDFETRHRLKRRGRRREDTVDFDKFPIGENEDVKRYLKSDLGQGRPSATSQTFENRWMKLPSLKNKNGDNTNYIPKGCKGVIHRTPILRPSGHRATALINARRANGRTKSFF